MSARWLVGLAILTASAAGACGGKVNLGERRAPGSTPDSVVDMAAGLGSPVGQPIAQLTAETRFDLLAVAEDTLYLGNFAGVSRCLKDNCAPTLEHLPRVGFGVDSLQVYEDALGVSREAPDQAWLATYSLPIGAEERVVLSDLPRDASVSGLLWYGGFVYWQLDIDLSVYRCALPSCDGGPEKVGSFSKAGQLQADGKLVFYNDQSFIYRYEAGAGRAVPLLADESLSEAATAATKAPAAPGANFIESIATTDGLLYASVAHSAGSDDCSESCPHDVVRWPVDGGARETIVKSQNLVVNVFAFADELVWIDAQARNDFDHASVLYSCLADACAATRRTLGQVVGTNATVVADDTDLYWFEAGPNLVYQPGAIRLANYQVRRAPRLSPAATE